MRAANARYLSDGRGRRAALEAHPLLRRRRSPMRTSKTPDAKLINLFLDMLAAEQGAGLNTLDAYRRDLSGFSRFFGRGGPGFVGGRTPTRGGLPAQLAARGFQTYRDGSPCH